VESHAHYVCLSNSCDAECGLVDPDGQFGGGVGWVEIEVAEEVEPEEGSFLACLGWVELNCPEACASCRANAACSTFMDCVTPCTAGDRSCAMGCFNMALIMPLMPMMTCSRNNCGEECAEWFDMM